MAGKDKTSLQVSKNNRTPILSIFSEFFRRDGFEVLLPDLPKK
jgi:hypothetical protein